MKINMMHKSMTDEECYETVKRLHEKYPEFITDPKEWLRSKGNIVTKD